MFLYSTVSTLKPAKRKGDKLNTGSNKRGRDAMRVKRHELLVSHTEALSHSMVQLDG